MKVKVDIAEYKKTIRDFSHRIREEDKFFLGNKLCVRFFRKGFNKERKFVAGSCRAFTRVISFNILPWYILKFFEFNDDEENLNCEVEKIWDTILHELVHLKEGNMDGIKLSSEHTYPSKKNLIYAKKYSGLIDLQHNPQFWRYHERMQKKFAYLFPEFKKSILEIKDER